MIEKKSRITNNLLKFVFHCDGEDAKKRHQQILNAPKIHYIFVLFKHCRLHRYKQKNSCEFHSDMKICISQ